MLALDEYQTKIKAYVFGEIEIAKQEEEIPYDWVHTEILLRLIIRVDFLGGSVKILNPDLPKDFALFQSVQL